MPSSKNISVDIEKERNYCLPAEALSQENIVAIQSFFQYKTANGQDSPLSLHLDTYLSDVEKDTLWNKMLQIANADEQDFIFNPILRNKISEIKSLQLSDTTFSCDRIKGFVHLNNQSKGSTKRSQHKVDAFFKRLRNAFAHGRIAKDKDYLIFEDKTNQITGRIILTEDVLLKWKAEIESIFIKGNKQLIVNKYDTY